MGRLIPGVAWIFCMATPPLAARGTRAPTATWAATILGQGDRGGEMGAAGRRNWVDWRRVRLSVD